MGDQIEQKHFNQNCQYKKLKNMFFFQFMMGCTILLCCWPGFFVLNYFGVEIFVFPSSSEWCSVLILTALNVAWCASILIGVTFSGAMFMSIGTLLVIPFSYIVDVVLYDLVITKISFIGSLFVIFDFILSLIKEGKHRDIALSTKIESNKSMIYRVYENTFNDSGL